MVSEVQLDTGMSKVATKKALKVWSTFIGRPMTEGTNHENKTDQLPVELMINFLVQIIGGLVILQDISRNI